VTLTEAVAYLEERRNHELAEESTDWALVEAIEIVIDKGGWNYPPRAGR